SRTTAPGLNAAATIACFCSTLHRRRRSGPANTSTLAIAPSLAPVQTPVFAPVLTSPINSQTARRPSAEGYGPATQRHLFRAGLSGRNRRSVLRRAQRRVRVFRQGAALDPLRQHAAGGGAHPRRRSAPEDAGIQRAAVALPVCRPVWPARQ